MGQDIKEVWKLQRNGETNPKSENLHHKLISLRLKSFQVGLQLRKPR